MSFQYYFIKFEILLVYNMRYKSYYKIFLVNIVKFLVNHHQIVGFFEKAKNVLQRSYVEIVYRNFHQRYLYEFLTKFDENSNKKNLYYIYLPNARCYNLVFSKLL